MLLKKKLWLVSILGFMIILVSGCGRKQVAKKISIQMFDANYANWIKLNNERIESFKKIAPDIRVRLITATGRLGKLQTMIGGGVAPDIAFLQVEEIALFAHKGSLLDLTPLIEKDSAFNINDYYSVIVKGMQYKGRQFGIPECFTPVVLFYNRDLFDEEGLSYPDESWTWKEFLEAAKRLTKDKDNDGKIDQYGTLKQMGNHRWPIWIWQNNGRVFNEDRTRCVIDSSEAIEALKWYYDLAYKHNVAPKYGEEIEGAPNQTVEILFGSGKIAMFASTRYYVEAGIKASKFNCDIAPLPKGKRRATTFVGGGWVIFKQSKHPEEAWKLIKFLVGEESLKMMGGKGALPAMKKAAEEMVNHPGEPPENDKVFIDSVKYSYDAPYLFENLSAWSKAEGLFQLVDVGKMNIEECCRKFARIINEAIEKK